MASAMLKEVLEGGKQEGANAGVMKVPSALYPERPGPRAKDHCDYLLDSIDAQLSQLQIQGPSGPTKGVGDNGKASLDRTACTSTAPDLGRCPRGTDGDASSGEDLSSWKEDYTWWLKCLIDSEVASGDQSTSDSVCTEDFAAQFNEGLVDPLLSPEEERRDPLALDVRPLKHNPREPAHAGPSLPLADLQAASDSYSVDLASKRRIAQSLKEGSKEQLRQALAHGSREPPSLCIQRRIRSLESLEEKISGRSQKWPGGISSATDAADSQPRERILQLQPLSSREASAGLGMGISPGSAFLGPREGRKGLENSLEQVQGTCKSSTSPLLLEDLRPSQPLQAADITILDGEYPLRTAGDCHPEKGQSGRPRGSLDMTCLCAVKAPHESCLVPSDGEDRGGLSMPWPLYPLGACATGNMQRLALSGLGMNTGATRVPVGGPCTLLSLASNGYVRCRKEWAMDAHCAEGHTEALGLKEYGNLQDKHHGPPSGQNEGWMEHFRGKLVAAAGLDTEKALSSPPQRDLLRSVGPSDSEEEEEFARLCTTSTHRTSEIWKQDPRKAADPGWKGAEREGHRNHKGLELEEENLSQKRAQIREADVSLRVALQQKKHVALELETVQEALEKSQKEARRLELHAEERRSKAEEARADLVLLEYKREACRREMLALEQELSVLRRQCSQYGAAQAEVSQLVTEREMLKDQVRHLEDNLSSLKHQLRTSKAELTSTKEAAEARTEQLQEVTQVVGEASGRIQGLERRVLALQAVLSEKELELSRLCEEHERRMEILQQEALQEKVKELAQLREELQGEKSQALQEFAVSAEQAKAKAFQEQAATFGKEIEDLRKTVKERDAEIARQQVATKQQAKVLKQEATEMVEHALLQERKKWEAETRAALQMQREALEEQDRRMQVDLQEAQQKERKSSLASQDETADLRKRIQELEIQARTSECEKRGATDELQVLLQEEKAHALRRLREELEQERMQEKEEGRTTLQQMEDTQRLLLAEQREAAFRARDSQEALSALADRSVAREVAVACLRLQDLLPQKSDMPTLTQMLQGSPALLSSSRALQALREVTEETQRYLQDLKREAEVQRHSALQFQGEKERELRQQQGQLHLESQAALEALKERLFQAHMKDIATLQRSWVREAGAKGHPSRRPQLQKDGEVQPSQRNVTCWRAKAARQLAKEFKEDLAAEVERRRSRNKSGDFPGDLEASESELGQFSMSQCEYPCFACSPSPNGAPFTSQRLFGTPELLHHPQSRTQELRAENTTYCRGSVDHRGGLWEDLVNTSRSKRPLTAELASPHLQGKSSWK